MVTDFDICRGDTPKNEFDNIKIIKGDITTFCGGAIVNAANEYLAPGGGVCGAIFNAAGYRKLEKACEELHGCEVGNAKITSGFNLKADYIIHAVGPHYFYNENPEQLLEFVYESCFKIALEKGIRSIAFPSISTGIYMFPIDKAIPIAMNVIKKNAPNFDEICVYCFGNNNTYNKYLRYVEE